MTDGNVNSIRQDCEALRTDFLSQRALIIAANWGPVVFERAEDGSLDFQHVAGGLVTALTSVCHYTDATWIACAQTEADAVWREGHIPLTDSDHSIKVRFLSPQASAYEGYTWPSTVSLRKPLLTKCGLWAVPLWLCCKTIIYT